MNFYALAPHKFIFNERYVEAFTDKKWSIAGTDTFCFKTNKDLKQYQAFSKKETDRKSKERAEKEAVEAVERLAHMMQEEVKKARKGELKCD